MTTIIIATIFFKEQGCIGCKQKTVSLSPTAHSNLLCAASLSWLLGPNLRQVLRYLQSLLGTIKFSITCSHRTAPFQWLKCPVLCRNPNFNFISSFPLVSSDSLQLTFEQHGGQRLRSPLRWKSTCNFGSTYWPFAVRRSNKSQMKNSIFDPLFGIHGWECENTVFSLRLVEGQMPRADSS